MYKVIKILDDKKLNNTQKTYNIHDILKLSTNYDINVVLNYIFKNKWGSGSGSGEKVFCYFADYDLVWYEFKKNLNIDLNKDEMGWWEFMSTLEALMLTKNSLSKRIGYRCTKIPIRNKDNNEQVDFLVSMKNKYTLQDKQLTKNAAFKSFTNFLKMKKKEKENKKNGRR